MAGSGALRARGCPLLASASAAAREAPPSAAQGPATPGVALPQGSWLLTSLPYFQEPTGWAGRGPQGGLGPSERVLRLHGKVTVVLRRVPLRDSHRDSLTLELPEPRSTTGSCTFPDLLL